ncbi:zinc finger protein 26, partial [Biomphalaria glabrata]
LKYKCSVCNVFKKSYQQLMRHSRKRDKENKLLETQHSMSHPLSSSTETREDLKPDGRMGLQGGQERHYINSTLFGQENVIDLNQVKQTNHDRMRGNQSYELKYKCSVCSVFKKSHQQLMRHSRKRHEENEWLETQQSQSHLFTSPSGTRVVLNPEEGIIIHAETSLGLEKFIDLNEVKQTRIGGNLSDSKFMNLSQGQQSKGILYNQNVSTPIPVTVCNVTDVLPLIEEERKHLRVRLLGALAVGDSSS